jgi:hypothetical protein
MIVAVTMARDDAALLPEWFGQLHDAVDGFVVLDVASRDATRAIAGTIANAEVITIDALPADRGQSLLVDRAVARGARWILWLDPDERIDRAFATELRTCVARAERDGRSVLGVWKRSLDASGNAVITHGTRSLDHEYMLVRTDVATPDDTPPAARRLLAGHAVYRPYVAALPAWRRRGRYATFEPDADIRDLQAQPARIRPRRAEDAATTWLEQIFAAAECDDWSALAQHWRDTDITITSDRTFDATDPVAVLRAWWHVSSQWRRFVAIEPVDDGVALIAYRGERRNLLPLAWCQLALEADRVRGISLRSFPPFWKLMDSIVAGAQRLVATPAAIQVPASTSDIALSVLMPYYKRLADFTKVLQLTAPYYERADTEVVLCMDEPSEEPGVLALLQRYPRIKWHVLVNDHDHPWRTPCCALNVGLRHAIGDYALVVSPESAFVSDVPGVMPAKLRTAGPGVGAVGRVAFAQYSEHASYGSLDETFRAVNAAAAGAVHPAFRNGPPYGSLCVERERLVRVGGYDEGLEQWGGDDDNMRARLLLDGVALGLSDDMRLVHLSEGPRREVKVRWGLANYLRAFEPASAIANGHDAWGRSFDRVAMSWR